jgi:hypothetical protein
MSRLTLRLPDSLHRQLETLAEQEAVSLNQYIVYALTRQVTLAYTVQPVPEQAVREQRARYAALLQRLGPATAGEIEAALAAREPAEPEPGLTPEVIQALHARLAKKQGPGR